MIEYIKSGKAFTAETTITKLDGTKLIIDKPVVSFPIDTL